MKNSKEVCLLLFSILILLTGCDPDERNLGNNYVLTGYGITTVIDKKIPESITIYKEVLLGEIVDYDFDDKFNVIYRVVSQKVKEHFSDNYLSEIFRGGDSTQFWIIQKNNDAI